MSLLRRRRLLLLLPPCRHFIFTVSLWLWEIFSLYGKSFPANFILSQPILVVYINFRLARFYILCISKIITDDLVLSLTDGFGLKKRFIPRPLY
jgi:hypothetical protein